MKHCTLADFCIYVIETDKPKQLYWAFIDDQKIPVSIILIACFISALYFLDALMVISDIYVHKLQYSCTYIAF